MTLTAERLREVLHYDAATGRFTWLKSHQKVSAGDAAGCLDDKGYVRIRIDGKRYRAHRLAWLYVTGDWPEDQIDHRDLDKANNAFLNLRQANNTQNNGNRKRQPNNTSGHRGVSWHSPRRRWRAIIYVGKKQVYLGTFNNKETAAEAYRLAAQSKFGEFARIP